MLETQLQIYSSLSTGLFHNKHRLTLNQSVLHHKCSERLAKRCENSWNLSDCVRRPEGTEEVLPAPSLKDDDQDTSDRDGGMTEKDDAPSDRTKQFEDPWGDRDRSERKADDADLERLRERERRNQEIDPDV